MSNIKQVIKEEDGLHNRWYEEADKITAETLPAFLDKLMNRYEYDYGTICHAITVGALATAKAIDRSPQGGITGFQAGCIMWEFITRWMHYDGLMRLIQYNDMLYPQCVNKFTTITPTVWKWVQEQAQKNLDKVTRDEVACDSGVKKHWQSIVDGNVPFGYTIAKE